MPLGHASLAEDDQFYSPNGLRAFPSTRWHFKSFRFVCEPTPSARALRDPIEVNTAIVNGLYKSLEAKRVALKNAEEAATIAANKTETKTEETPAANQTNLSGGKCWYQVIPGTPGTLDRAWVYSHAGDTLEVKEGGWGNKRRNFAASLCQQWVNEGKCASCAGEQSSDPNIVY